MPAITLKGTSSSRKSSPVPVDDIRRARLVIALLVAVFAVFIIKAFYLQVIRHDYYSKAALNYQLKEYQIPAERGVILAKNGSSTTPLVLNETKFTLFADPIYVKDHKKTADKLAPIIGKASEDVEKLLDTSDTRYVVLAKKLDKKQQKAIDDLDINGIGTRDEVYRTYPQDGMASQILGFVNDEGKGQYGVEGFLDDILKGRPGELKAITDAKGVPLVSSPDNIINESKPGRAVTLSIDIGIQSQLEDILKTGVERSKSKSGSVLVMRPSDGKVVAMAGYPTFNPGSISDVHDMSVFTNPNTDTPFEIGSIMKVLTASAALDQKVVNANTEFYDAGYVEVGDAKITDVTNSQGTQSVESLLVKSLNTGAVWLLKQLGRGSINERARFTWNDYMTNHFQLGKPTGIEQVGEAAGLIPGPEDKGQGIDVIYANTSFGQGMMATPIQMAAALSSILNGGTYYRPSVIDSVRDDKGKDIKKDPEVVKQNVVSQDVSDNIMRLTESVADKHFPNMDKKGYHVGGKTGTAEIARPEGGYYKDRYNGTFMGYVGGDKAEYVIIVTTIEPKIPGYAGSVGAAPIFADTVNMLLHNVGVSPMD